MEDPSPAAQVNTVLATSRSSSSSRSNSPPIQQQQEKQIPPLTEGYVSESTSTHSDAEPNVLVASATVKPTVQQHPVPAVVKETTEKSNEEQLSDSLSLLKDTLPGFKSTPSPASEQESHSTTTGTETTEVTKETAVNSPSQDCRDQRVATANGVPPLKLPDKASAEADDDSSESEIDEDALSIIIAVEGEDDDDEQNIEDESMRMEVVEREGPPSLTNVDDTAQQTELENVQEKQGNKDKVIDLTENTSMDEEQVNTSDKGCNGNSTLGSFKSSISKADSTQATPASDSNSVKDQESAAQRLKQSAKVKQFFTTLQVFGNKASQEIAEQVQELIAALVNDLVTVEEFHQEIQRVTNHPMKDFVVPFLKENLGYFRNELKSTSLALSDVLGTAPKSSGPAVAPDVSEPELVVVHSTKPSTPVTTSTVITMPTSPLKAPANLTSMSVPPATIHEPQLISPTKIESVINSSVLASNRKRPRDLMMGNGGDERDGSLTHRISKRSRPIPTATLTPEPAPPPVSSTTPSPASATHHTLHSSFHHSSSSHPVHHHGSSSSSSASSSSISSSLTGQHQHQHHVKSTPVPPSQSTPVTDLPAGVTMLGLTSTQRMAAINQVKEDWNHLETMFVSVEGMVVKTQKALSNLKERIQQIGLGPSPAQLKAYETEIEQRVQRRMEKTLEEVRHQASEEKQKILLDATKQLRDTIREMNMQSTSKESCWNCGRKATETCSGCNKARYCGTFCQHKDWDRHMKQCAGARSAATVRVEKERPPVQINAIPHNHAATMKPSAHYIAGPHPSHSSPGASYRRSTSSRTPTPTSYVPAGSEIYLPVNDPLSNGGNVLTSTSSGVAVVTINRTPGDHPGLI